VQKIPKMTAKTPIIRKVRKIGQVIKGQEASATYRHSFPKKDRVSLIHAILTSAGAMGPIVLKQASKAFLSESK